jgi:heat shock protein HslJ
MQQEARFFSLLKSVDSYHAEPDRLEMLADGSIVLAFEPYQEKPTP